MRPEKVLRTLGMNQHDASNLSLSVVSRREDEFRRALF